jgi:hypothetical protein
MHEMALRFAQTIRCRSKHACRNRAFDAERRAEKSPHGVLIEDHEVVPAHHKNLVMEQRNITSHEAFDRSRCGDSNLGASEHM